MKKIETILSQLCWGIVLLILLIDLKSFNELLLKDFESRITDWDRHPKIADIFISKGPFLKLFYSYIREYESQCKLLDDCCKKYPLFANAVKEFEMSPRCESLPVSQHMLKPVQRITQYQMLLDKYIRNLPEDSPDYKDAESALQIMESVGSNANKTMKQVADFKKLLELQTRLCSGGNETTDGGSVDTGVYELIKAGRHLIKEGELLKLNRKGMQQRYFILLSDVLLYTSYRSSSPNGGLQLNYEMPLETVRLDTNSSEDFKNEFIIISTKRSVTLQAKSASERDAWITALQDAISENASRRHTFQQMKTNNFKSSVDLGTEAPVWIPDNRVTMCQQCTAEFTITFRRHHCRACGKVVCYVCSTNRAPLQYKSYQSDRVCDSCYENLYDGVRKMSKEDKSSEYLLERFKKRIRSSNRTIKWKPSILKLSADDESSQMKGYLFNLVRKNWQRRWFLLKDMVLYEYKAPKDACAITSLPILGYSINRQVPDLPECTDQSLCFQLEHPNQEALIYYAESPQLTEKWIQAMQEAVVFT